MHNNDDLQLDCITNSLGYCNVTIQSRKFEVATQFGYFVAIEEIGVNREVVFQNIRDEFIDNKYALQLLDDKGWKSFIEYLISQEIF